MGGAGDTKAAAAACTHRDRAGKWGNNGLVAAAAAAAAAGVGSKVITSSSVGGTHSMAGGGEGARGTYKHTRHGGGGH